MPPPLLLARSREAELNLQRRPQQTKHIQPHITFAGSLMIPAGGRAEHEPGKLEERACERRRRAALG